MSKSYDKKLKEFKDDLKNVLDIFIKDNNLIIDIINNCSKESISKAKKELNNDTILITFEKLDERFINIFSSKEIQSDDLKSSSKFLKINSDTLKISRNIRTVITKLQDCCKDFEHKDIKKITLKIYKNLIKILDNIKLMLELDDTNDIDEINDAYEQIVILESKIDTLYEDINKYIIKELASKDTHENLMKVLRKTEKTASRTVSIASLLKYGN